MLPIVCGSSVLSLFCYTLLCVHFSFAIILKRKRKLVALLFLSYRCIVTIYVMWLFLTVPWVGLQYVIVVFPDHTHFLAISILVTPVAGRQHFQRSSPLKPLGQLNSNFIWRLLMMGEQKFDQMVLVT